MNFAAAIERCLRQIPAGRVASCCVIAAALGEIRSARAVATWLLGHPNAPNAHRVVRADGRPMTERAAAQLTAEAIRLSRGRVPIRRLLETMKPVGFFPALRDEQRRLAQRMMERDEGGAVDRITGVDLSYSGDRAYAVAATVDRATLEPLEIATAERTSGFPYVPTYLGYREFPGIEAAVHRLSHPPDVLLVDGHGRLHPAGFGSACFVGVRLDLPTIGVAKRPLAGRIDAVAPRTRGAAPVRLDGEVRGYAWVPPGRSRPIYVSVGNRISLERALELVQQTTRHGYPEPLRLADRMSKERKGAKNGKKV